MMQNKELDSVLSEHRFKDKKELRAYLVGVLEAELDSTKNLSSHDAETAVERLQQAVNDYQKLKKELDNQ